VSVSPPGHLEAKPKTNLLHPPPNEKRSCQQSGILPLSRGQDPHEWVGFYAVHSQTVFFF